MDHQLIELAEHLGRLLCADGKKIATAESCTGGAIAEAITEIPGSSAWFECGFVTYSNTAKMRMLDVKSETLAHYGAVSAETANEMVTGALTRSNADYAIAVTGIAGPDGGTPEKPVGTVFIAWQSKNGQPRVVREQLSGNRRQIRSQTVKIAIEGVWS